MPKVLLPTFLLACLLLSCSRKSEPATETAPPPEPVASAPAAAAPESAKPAGMVAVAIPATGGDWAKLTLVAPKGAVATVSDDKEMLAVTAGDHFDMSVTAGGEADVKASKDNLEITAGKIEKLLVDEPAVYIAKTDKGFNFAATVKVGDKSLVCENAAGAFERADVDAMLESCRSLASR